MDIDCLKAVTSGPYETTSWNAIGAVDNDKFWTETLVGTREAQDYLTFVNKNLAPYNHEVFANLQKGVEPKESLLDFCRKRFRPQPSKG